MGLWRLSELMRVIICKCLEHIKSLVTVCQWLFMNRAPTILLFTNKIVFYFPHSTSKEWILGTDWTQGLGTHLHTSPVLFTFFRQGLAKSLRCPGWDQNCDPPASASENARITRQAPPSLASHLTLKQLSSTNCLKSTLTNLSHRDGNITNFIHIFHK